jgi:uncharacterized NAD(P)/FAD-binding protein YdhS
MQTIVIIGAGLRGRLCFINLVHTFSEELRIFLVDKKEKSGTDSASELIYTQQNLPVNKLSAFPNQPNHFKTWLQEQGYTCHFTDTVPYSLYYAYVEEMFQSALALQSSVLDLHVLNDEATDILILQRKAFTQLKSGITLMSDKVVLATGDITAAVLNDKQAALERNMHLNGFMSIDSHTNKIKLAPNGALLDARGIASSILYSLSSVRTLAMHSPKASTANTGFATLAGFNRYNTLANLANL